MGELVDINTTPSVHSIFYKISSGSLRFQVRGPSNARVGLARSSVAAAKDIIWFNIGKNGKSTVDKGSVEFYSAYTPDILCEHEFRSFWMQWHGNIICLGRAYEEDPFMVHQEQMCDLLTYVTFGVIFEDPFLIQWKFEMPPLYKQMNVRPISNEVPRWVSTEDEWPTNALIGGFENEHLYIIRAKHEGSLTPGKFVPSLGVGFIPWGGQAHAKNELEVLCGCDCLWIPCSDGRVPLGAVVAGHAEDTFEKLYVGRAKYNDHVIPGKVQPSHHVCYIPYAGNEINVRQYEVLVVPHRNVQCGNPFFDLDHVMRMR